MTGPAAWPGLCECWTREAGKEEKHRSNCERHPLRVENGRLRSDLRAILDAEHLAVAGEGRWKVRMERMLYIARAALQSNPPEIPDGSNSSEISNSSRPDLGPFEGLVKRWRETTGPTGDVPADVAAVLRTLNWCAQDLEQAIAATRRGEP